MSKKPIPPEDAQEILRRLEARDRAIEEIEQVWWDIPGLAADACLAVALHVLKDPKAWRERLCMDVDDEPAADFAAQLPHLERLEGDWDD